MAFTGVESAIRELEREQAKINNVISILKRISNAQSAPTGSRQGRRTSRKLSPEARRRISEAAKKRWAALRAKQGRKTA